MKGRMAEDEKADWKQRLPEIARHASERERLSMEAEREVIQRKRVKFMVDKVEALYEGVVTGVAAYGLFVELKPFFVEGFLHISALPDDYYLYDEKRHLLIGEHQRKVFRLGDPIVIRVRSVDVENMKIDFELAPTGKKSVKRPSKN
jgi:ribonuclease R